MNEVLRQFKGGNYDGAVLVCTTEATAEVLGTPDRSEVYVLQGERFTLKAEGTREQCLEIARGVIP